MAYSKKVVDRFNEVLNSPKQFNVGRFDPKDPNVATGMTGANTYEPFRLFLNLEYVF